MKTSLRGVVTGIGATVAIVTAVSLPAAYFAAGYANLSHRLGFEAELNASYPAKYISGHEGRYTATKSATPITISAMPESSRADSGCLNE
jgi:hypothetical protein